MTDYPKYPRPLNWWQTLLFLAIVAAVFTLLFILGDLILYGRVNW